MGHKNWRLSSSALNLMAILEALKKNLSLEITVLVAPRFIPPILSNEMENVFVLVEPEAFALQCDWSCFSQSAVRSSHSERVVGPNGVCCGIILANSNLYVLH